MFSNVFLYTPILILLVYLSGFSAHAFSRYIARTRTYQRRKKFWVFNYLVLVFGVLLFVYSFVEKQPLFAYASIHLLVASLVYGFSQR